LTLGRATEEERVETEKGTSSPQRGHGAGEPLCDPISVALAHALTEATRAGQWGVVAQIAQQIEARERLTLTSTTTPTTSTRGQA
jgi:hypothetical protein